MDRRGVVGSVEDLRRSDEESSEARPCVGLFIFATIADVAVRLSRDEAPIVVTTSW